MKAFNLFARELQAMLAARGAAIKDLQRAPLYIHRMTVKRLEQSYEGCVQSYPMLSPDDLQAVIKAYELTSLEIARLKSAILANAIGAKLMDRITIDRAIYVAEQTFEILVLILQEAPEVRELITLVQAGAIPSDDDNWDVFFAPIATRYDQATLALNMSYEFGQETDRIASAHQAHLIYQELLVELQAFPLAQQHNEYWQFYITSIRDGDTQALAIIQASKHTP